MSLTRIESLVVRSILMQSLHELVPPLSWLKGVQIQYVFEHPLLHRLYLQNISRYEQLQHTRIARKQPRLKHLCSFLLQRGGQDMSLLA